MKLTVQVVCSLGIIAALGFVGLEVRQYTSRASLESRRMVAESIGATGGLPRATTGEEQRIRESRAASNAAIAARDVPGVLASMSDDIRIIASGGDLLEGKEAVAAAFEGQFTNVGAVYVRTPLSVEVHESGDRAAESGRWVGTWEALSGPFRTGGSYLADWEREDGAWRIRSELFVALFCEGDDCR